MYKPKRYFVVAVETEDEKEAIEAAWKLRARFVWDMQRNKLATIITTNTGSKLVTYDKQGRAE